AGRRHPCEVLIYVSWLMCLSSQAHEWHYLRRASLRRRAKFRKRSEQRWGNRPAFLWIAERFGVLRFRLMVKRGPCMRPQASEGEAQHGLFCWTRRVGPGDERLHCG